MKTLITKKLILAGALPLAYFFAATGAQAAITACKDNATGAMRVAPACNANETALA